MNNAIKYVTPKNNTMAHSMILNIKTFYVVGIYTFGFHKYCQTVFDFMDIYISPTFKQLLKA